MTNNEQAFMDYFSKNLKDKTQANYDTIREASRLIGRTAQLNCGSCMRSEYLELLNIYNRLEPHYHPFVEKAPEGTIKPIGDVFTRYEAIDEVFERVKNLEEDKELIITKTKRK